jgi:hypothetical protein
MSRKKDRKGLYLCKPASRIKKKLSRRSKTEGRDSRI